MRFIHFEHVQYLQVLGHAVWSIIIQRSQIDLQICIHKALQFDVYLNLFRKNSVMDIKWSQSQKMS